MRVVRGWSCQGQQRVDVGVLLRSDQGEDCPAPDGVGRVVGEIQAGGATKVRMQRFAHGLHAGQDAERVGMLGRFKQILWRVRHHLRQKRGLGDGQNLCQRSGLVSPRAQVGLALCGDTRGGAHASLHHEPGHALEVLLVLASANLADLAEVDPGPPVHAHLLDGGAQEHRADVVAAEPAQEPGRGG